MLIMIAAGVALLVLANQQARELLAGLLSIAFGLLLVLLVLLWWGDREARERRDCERARRAAVVETYLETIENCR